MVSLLRESMAACTSTLNSSWEDSWPMPPWHSYGVPSKPCSCTLCLPCSPFLGLVGLQALQLFPDGRNVPEARESSGSEWKAVSSGLTVVVKHPFILSGCGEPWAPALSDCSTVARFSCFPPTLCILLPQFSGLGVWLLMGCRSARSLRNSRNGCVDVHGPVFAERLHTPLHGSAGKPPGSC